MLMVLDLGGAISLQLPYLPLSPPISPISRYLPYLPLSPLSPAISPTRCDLAAPPLPPAISPTPGAISLQLTVPIVRALGIRYGDRLD